jgi:hypothetical protein
MMLRATDTIEHDGTRYAAGDMLAAMGEDQAEALIRLGVAELVEGAAPETGAETGAEGDAEPAPRRKGRA